MMECGFLLVPKLDVNVMIMTIVVFHSVYADNLVHE